MNGRLENAIKTENNIDKLLRDMPQYITEYYLNLSSKREPKTCLEYLRKIKNFLSFLSNDIKSVNFSAITDVDIAKYMKSIETTTKNGITKETSFSYRKQNHTILNSFFGYLYKKEYIDKNPMIIIEREIKKDKPQRKFLKEDDLKEILNVVENGAGTERQINCQEKWRDRDKLIFMLFMQTGMRETALTEININDINIEEKTLYIIDKEHEKHMYKLSEELLNVLQEWIYIRDNILGNEKCDALIISKRKKRITSTGIAKLVRKYTEEALGEEISPHKLRAAYCNMLLRKTNNLYLVSKLVGHKRPETTEIYLDDISIEDKELAANIISESLFK